MSLTKGKGPYCLCDKHITRTDTRTGRPTSTYGDGLHASELVTPELLELYGFLPVTRENFRGGSLIATYLPPLLRDQVQVKLKAFDRDLQEQRKAAKSRLED